MLGHDCERYEGTGEQDACKKHDSRDGPGETKVKRSWSITMHQSPACQMRPRS